LRSRVVALMESGGDCRSVGKISGIAPSTAGNWHRRYRQTQSYAARPMGGDHRSRQHRRGRYLPAHKVAAIRKCLEDAGMGLLYLLAYSPDFNPIELVFSKLKAL
jgi:transposase